MGCGGCGGREGLRTLTLPRRTAHGPSQCSGHSSGTAAGRVALLRGPDSASCSAKTSHGPCLAGCWPEAEQAATGAWGGLGDAEMGSCRQGRLLGVPGLIHFPVLQSSRRPTGSHWRRTWRSQGMGLMQSSAWGTPLHTCLISKVSWGRGEEGEHLCVHGVFQQAENVS